jgi:ABC-type proline/glycine betaine transport system permease subunit
MTLLDNDVETDLRFGQTYSLLALLTKVVLSVLSVLCIEDHLMNSKTGVAEFINILLTAPMLALHGFLVVAAIYMAKKSSGIITISQVECQ